MDGGFGSYYNKMFGKKYGTSMIDDDDDISKVYNPYDNGEIWSNPNMDAPTSYSSGYSPAMNYAKKHGIQISGLEENQIEDPYASPRNKINTYTRKLNEAGLDVEAPDTQKDEYGLLEGFGDVFNVASTPINMGAKVIDNEYAKGSKSEKIVKEIIDTDGFKKFAESKGKKVNNGNILSKITDVIGEITTFGTFDQHNAKINKNKELLEEYLVENADARRKYEEYSGEKEKHQTSDALKTGLSSVSGIFVKPFADKETRDWYRKNEFSVVDMIGNVRTEDYYNDLSKGVVGSSDFVMENTLGRVANGILPGEASDERRKALGQFGTDFLGGALLEGSIDFDDAGKAMSYMKNVRSGKVDDIVNNTSLKQAEEAIKSSKNAEIDELARKNVMEKLKGKITEETMEDADELGKINDEAINIEKAKLKEGLNVSDEAEAMLRKVRDEHGDYDFEGLKYAGVNIVSKDRLKQLAQKDSTYRLTQAGLFLANPLSAPYSLGKGSTKDAVERLSKNEYEDTLGGQASKTKDKLLEEIYDKFAGGKNGELKKIGIQDKSQALNAEASARSINELGYKAQKNTLQRIKEVNQMKSDMKKEYGDVNSLDKIREVVEKPLREVVKNKVTDKMDYSNAYKLFMGKESRNKIEQLIKMVDGQIELNGKRLTSKDKLSKQMELKKTKQYLENQKALQNSEELDFKKQVKKVQKELGLNNKAYAKDVKLNNLQYVMKSSDKKIAYYLSETYDMKYNEAMDVANSYKIAGENVFKTIENVSGKSLKGKQVYTKEYNIENDIIKKFKNKENSKSIPNTREQEAHKALISGDDKFAKSYQKKYADANRLNNIYNTTKNEGAKERIKTQLEELVTKIKQQREAHLKAEYSRNPKSEAKLEEFQKLYNKFDYEIDNLKEQLNSVDEVKFDELQEQIKDLELRKFEMQQDESAKVMINKDKDNKNMVFELNKAMREVSGNDKGNLFNQVRNVMKDVFGEKITKDQEDFIKNLEKSHKVVDNVRDSRIASDYKKDVERMLRAETVDEMMFYYDRVKFESKQIVIDNAIRQSEDAKEFATIKNAENEFNKKPKKGEEKYESNFDKEEEKRFKNVRNMTEYEVRNEVTEGYKEIVKELTEFEKNYIVNRGIELDVDSVKLTKEQREKIKDNALELLEKRYKGEVDNNIINSIVKDKSFDVYIEDMHKMRTIEMFMNTDDEAIKEVAKKTLKKGESLDDKVKFIKQNSENIKKYMSVLYPEIKDGKFKAVEKFEKTDGTEAKNVIQLKDGRYVEEGSAPIYGFTSKQDKELIEKKKKEILTLEAKVKSIEDGTSKADLEVKTHNNDIYDEIEELDDLLETIPIDDPKFKKIEDQLKELEKQIVKYDPNEDLKFYGENLKKAKGELKELEANSKRLVYEKDGKKLFAKDKGRIYEAKGKKFYNTGDIATKKTSYPKTKQIEKMLETVEAIRNTSKNSNAIRNGDSTFNKLVTLINENEPKGYVKIYPKDMEYDTVKQYATRAMKMDSLIKYPKKPYAIIDDNYAQAYIARFKKMVDIDLHQITKVARAELEAGNVDNKTYSKIMSNIIEYKKKLVQANRDEITRANTFGTVGKINDRGDNFNKVKASLLGLMNKGEIERIFTKEMDIKNPNKELIIIKDQLGELGLDVTMTPKQAQKAFKALSEEFDGVANVNFLKDIGSEGMRIGKSIFVDPAKKKIGATLSHEFGHVMDSIENKQNVMKILGNFSRTISEMDNKAYESLVKFINRNTATGVSKGIDLRDSITGYTDHLRKMSIPAKKDYTFQREQFAEIMSLALHQDIKVREKFLKFFGDDMNKMVYGLLANSKHKKLKEFVVPEWKRTDVEYVKRIETLQKELSMMKDIATWDEVKLKKAEINNLLDKEDMVALESVYKSIDKDFKLPEGVTNEKALRQYNEEVSYIVDRTKELEEVPKLVYDKLTKMLKEMGIEEEVVKPITLAIKEYYDYMPHILNSKYKDNKQVSAIYNKIMGSDSMHDDIRNVYGKSRKFEGTIEEINRQLAEHPELRKLGIKDFFETSTEKIMMKRIMDNYNVYFDTNARKMLYDTMGQETLNATSFRNKFTYYDNDKLVYDFGEMEKYFDSIGMRKAPIYKGAQKTSDMLKVGIERKQRQIDKSKFYDNTKLEKTKGIEDDMLSTMDVEMRDIKDGDRFNAYFNAYREWLTEKINTGDYELVKINERSEKVNIRAIDEKNYQKAMADRQGDDRYNYGVSEFEGDVLNVVENQVRNEGYAENVLKVDPGTLTPEVLEKHIHDGYMLINKNVSDVYENISKTQFNQSARGFAKLFKKMTGIFKTGALFTPSFHLGNMVGNDIKNYTQMGFEIFNVARRKQAFDIFNGRNQHKTIRNGMTYKKVLEEFNRLGGENGQYATEFKDVKGKIDELLGGKAYKERSKFNPIGISENAGEQIENNGKLTNFIYHLEKGKVPSEAMDMTNKALFDYSDLTSFENGTMKNIFPFYTFMMKNLKAQVEGLPNGSKEGRILNILQDINDKNESEQDRALAPDYMQEGIALGGNMYLKDKTPLGAFVDVLSPNKVLSSLNPLIKSPVEAITNTKFFDGNKISQFNDSGEKARYVAESMNPLIRLAGNLYNANFGSEFNKESAIRSLNSQWGLNMVDTYDTDKATKKAMDKYAEQLNEQYFRDVFSNEEMRKREEENRVMKEIELDRERARKKAMNAYYRKHRTR